MNTFLSKFQRFPYKIVLILALIILVHGAIFYMFLQRAPVSSVLPRRSLPYVVVHIDLKGSPPKLKYLVSLLPSLQQLGVNGLLIEYDDMFPYENKLKYLSALYSYKKDELKDFLRIAYNAGFEIIPLVQVFSGMEHVLKLRSQSWFREQLEHPDTICPSRLGSQILIKRMLRQVIRFHNEIASLKHIHIGCSKVHPINKCKVCNSVGDDDMEVYLEHIKIVREFVKSLNNKTRVLIWDDMIRNKMPFDDRLKGLEPVCWDFKADIDISSSDFDNYHRIFKNIWISSAYKGVDGRTSSLPDLTNRYMNHLSWITLIGNYKLLEQKEVNNFKGIILTGRSRYTHMDPLCELLPASIPSLYVNLLLIKKFKEGLFINTINVLDMKELFKNHLLGHFKTYLSCEDAADIYDLSKCNYTGIELYVLMLRYEELRAKVTEQIVGTESFLEVMEYYDKSDRINLNRLRTKNSRWCATLQNELTQIELGLDKVLRDYYEKFVINEYVGFKTHYIRNTLNVLKGRVEKYDVIRHWPQRGNRKSRDRLIYVD